MYMSRLVFVLLFAFSASYSLADGNDDLMAHAREAKKQGDTPTAMSFYKQASDAGYSEGSFYLALEYENSKKPKSAFHFALLGAQQGFSRSQRLVAQYYKRGYGTPADIKQTRAWMKKSAEQGYSEAQRDYGVMLKEGEGGVVDGPDALRYYRLAAAQGLPHAWQSLGALFNEGCGSIPIDKGSAFRYYSVGARLGYEWSQCTIGLMKEKGEGTYRDLDGAALWYKIATDQNSKFASERLPPLLQKLGSARAQKVMRLAAEFSPSPLDQLKPELYIHEHQVLPNPVQPGRDFGYGIIFSLLAPQNLADELTIRYAYVITKDGEPYVTVPVSTMRIMNGQPAVLALQQFHAGQTPGHYILKLGIEYNGTRWPIEKTFQIATGRGHS